MSAGSPRSDKASAALATKKRTTIAMPPPYRVTHAPARDLFIFYLWFRGQDAGAASGNGKETSTCKKYGDTCWSIVSLIE